MIKDYRIKIKNNVMYETLIIVDEIINNCKNENNNEEKIKLLCETQLIKLLNILKGYYRKNNLALHCSFVSSLLKYLNDLKKGKEFNIIKYKNVIIQYLNLQYANIEENRIKEYLQNEGKINKKLILALGLVELDDQYKVNEEIKMIFNTAKDTRFIVIPCFGCTIDVFNSLIKNYNFDYIHIAGHGTNEKLSFVSSNLTATKFEKIFYNNNKQVRMIVLNCCYSKQYYDNIPKGYLQNQFIVYVQKLPCDTAYNFSEDYYTNLILKKETPQKSFTKAKRPYYEIY